MAPKSITLLVDKDGHVIGAVKPIGSTGLLSAENQHGARHDWLETL